MDLPGLRARLKGGLAGKAALGAASLAYGAAVRTRRLLYDWNVLGSSKLGCRVVCFGNLTAGGTGKTPAVALAAQTLRQRKYGVVILSRGYGRKAGKKEVVVLRDGHVPPWTECGDEPWMLHQALQGLDVPILVAPDRVAAGLQALSFFQPDVILLDDGFGHLRLKRDLDVLMVHAARPFGDRRLLPYGDLREPLSALSRAKLIVLTHADQVKPSELDLLKDELQERSPGAAVVESCHRPDYLLDASADRRLEPGSLRGQKAVSLSGIAEPEQFESLLASLGVELVQRWRFPDHHPFTLEEVRSIANARKGLPVVTTMKDLVRLPEGWKEALGPGLHGLAVKLEITKGKATWAKLLTEGLVSAHE
ncbi:MAG: tetraacyldisaccharide 4'-kinase [Elusimicrobia bacterium]|nr:tetraacyldisaccharide 4'-kinase [Elusimicrobiota bacterium]